MVRRSAQIKRGDLWTIRGVGFRGVGVRRGARACRAGPFAVCCDGRRDRSASWSWPRSWPPGRPGLPPPRSSASSAPWRSSPSGAASARSRRAGRRRSAGPAAGGRRNEWPPAPARARADPGGVDRPRPAALVAARARVPADRLRHRPPDAGAADDRAVVGRHRGALRALRLEPARDRPRPRQPDGSASAQACATRSSASCAREADGLVVSDLHPPQPLDRRPRCPAGVVPRRPRDADRARPQHRHLDARGRPRGEHADRARATRARADRHPDAHRPGQGPRQRGAPTAVRRSATGPS